MEKINWEKIVSKMLWWQWVFLTAGLVMGAGLWFTMAKRLPPQIPLLYSHPWGEEQLADKVFLWLPIGITVLTAAIITLIIKKIKLDKVLTAILLGIVIIGELILLLSVVRIVLIVV